MLVQTTEGAKWGLRGGGGGGKAEYLEYQDFDGPQTHVGDSLTKDAQAHKLGCPTPHLSLFTAMALLQNGLKMAPGDHNMPKTHREMAQVGNISMGPPLAWHWQSHANGTFWAIQDPRLGLLCLV